VTPPRTRVLVVDDDALVGRLLERFLKRHYDVTVVTSAAAALARIEAGERYDLILCDRIMPGMTGEALYDVLLGTAPEQVERMVFLSGGVVEGAHAEFSRRAAANLHLQKPVDPTLLIEQLDSVLARLGPLASRGA
jgi:two-component system NtrC family sensor kinase